MKVRMVKFPDTPQATVEKVKELQPFLNAYFEAVDGVDLGGKDAYPNETYVMMWHNQLIDFIEVLDDNHRAGILVLSYSANIVTDKYVASVLYAYVEPKYRSKGYFRAMLNYAKEILQTKRFDYLDITIRNENHLRDFGERIALVKREVL